MLLHGYVKKNDKTMRKEAMAQSISEHKSRDLWKEVHNVIPLWGIVHDRVQR